MAALLYKDDHNKVAYLEKGKGWEAYGQILDFINRFHIRYALTHHPPIVFDSLVKQFWATATVHTHEAGSSKIIATINGNEVVVTESLISTQLQLNDETGLYEFTLHDVLDGMQEIGTYNFSRFILDGMIGNIGSKRNKFLMYPRFLQMILGIQTTDPSPRPTFDFTTKLFSTMKLNWDGPYMPLLAPMLVVPAGRDGADAVAAGAAAANKVPPPPVTPPPDVPSTHTSSSTPGPFTAAQDTPVRDPTPMREPTPSPMREPTTFQKPTPEPPRPSPPSPPPCPIRQTSFIENIGEDGGGYVSSPKSNEALPTTAATATGGAKDSVALTDLSFKLDRCINKVITLENELGVTKKVLGGGVLKLVSRVKRHTRTKRRRLRKTFTSSAFEHFQENIFSVEDTISAGAGIPADAQTIPASSTPIPTTGGVSVGSSMDPAGQAVTVAPSSSAIPAVDKGKAPMVDDSIPANLLTEQERVLKNLYDYQLGEDLAKKLHAEQESEFARQQEELAQKAQAELLLHLLHKLLGDDVNEENMNERLGMLLMRKRRELAEQSRDKPMNKTHQRDFMRDFVKNQSASVYNQGWTMKQVPVSVPVAPSIATDVSVSAVSTTIADVSPAPTLPVESVAEVHANESRPNENQTASEQVSAEHTSTTVAFTSRVSHATPSSSRKRRKQIAKKRVTPIVDVADDALIKFDNASEGDGDPSPYAPYADWEMVPTPFGSIHVYYDMEEHTKHFTSLRELLHMVEKSDLRRLLGDVDKFYQRQEPETVGLILWGDLRTVDGRVVYMFVDVSYPLSEATLERMLRHGLKVPKLLVGGDLTMAEQLVCFIKAALLNAQSTV
uniref:Synaptobrevin, longin-like domain protein n=1 Tax=Tanacetum cinerariifolium TaxID=118510 RepID=A0A6L2NND0_TANCI|nr:synaptobrevin, longin-like domain protein [Tanacetum cinerariifolium]